MLLPFAADRSKVKLQLKKREGRGGVFLQGQLKAASVEKCALQPKKEDLEWKVDELNAKLTTKEHQLENAQFAINATGKAHWNDQKARRAIQNKLNSPGFDSRVNHHMGFSSSMAQKDVEDQDMHVSIYGRMMI